MDKNTFLKKLKQMLSVLSEDEQKDIISEYEQHIDLKVKSGLSEEEAIHDFGALPELAADILRAYHVRPDYAQETYTDTKHILDSAGKRGKELLRRAADQCGKAFRTITRHLKNIFSSILSIPSFFRHRHDKTTHPAQEAATQTPSSIPAVPATFFKKSCRCSASLLRRLWNLLLRFVLLCLRLAAWGIRLIWNAVWTGLALLCLFMGLLSLFLLGALIILTIQRYPLNGITIGCLGMVLCTFSAAGLSATFIRKNGSRQITGQTIQSLKRQTEGGHYE